MFTGLIRELGVITRLRNGGGLLRLELSAPRLAARVGVLESVAVNGVCLTVTRAQAGRLEFEMIPETRQRTALARLRRGDQVHLEPSLTLADRLNGHLVLGHVDGVGRVISRRQRPGMLVVTVQADAAVRRWLVPKGPITVDGVSLTVGPGVRGGRFMLFLIPETLKRTTLGERRAGDLVNLEADYLAKLVMGARR